MVQCLWWSEKMSNQSSGQATMADWNIALWQMNATVGDFAGNAAKIESAARQAERMGAGLLLTPEMSLVGYPAEDWILRDDFCEKSRRVLVHLAETLKDTIPVLVGTVWKEENGIRRNALAFLRNGCIEALYFKQHLPEYGVFDEPRVFSAGDQPVVIEVNGVRLGLAICEDLWHPDVMAQTCSAGAQVILSANASPFEAEKSEERERTILPFVKRNHIPLVYVNAVGGQDELVFDGVGFATDAEGTVFLRQPSFAEDLQVVSVRALMKPQTAVPLKEDEEQRLTSMYGALTMALSDYVHKNGFKQVVIGLSGGIDSALVATIAADVLGADNVLAVMMPTRFTADLSFDLAKQLVKNLRIPYVVRPIEDLFKGYQALLADDFAGKAWDVTEENLQARIRGTVLMAYSNKFGRLVITTGNKSETAIGYSTLYGDTAGAFALIKDVYKTDVWALARFVNRHWEREVIPEALINRPPSAELREGQLDEASLPKYAVLDAFLKAYVDDRQSLEEAVDKARCDRATAERIVRLVHRNEYKRRQSPTGPKLSGTAFGRDWRYPMTAK